MERVDERDYFRARLPGIAVMYNIIPAEAGVPRSLALFTRTSPPGSTPGFNDDDPFQRHVVTVLARLTAKLDRLIGYYERNQGGSGYAFTSEALNVSGGGVSLSGSFRHPADTLLDLCLLCQYGVPHAIFALGRVRWVRELVSDSREFRYVSGVEFVEIGEDDRELIVRMVFHAERQQRQQEQGER
jgi:hypothetical protein